jgi:hypothetical protein
MLTGMQNVSEGAYFVKSDSCLMVSCKQKRICKIKKVLIFFGSGNGNNNTGQQLFWCRGIWS